MRSVFSAGVLDGFLEHSFNPFSFSIGVSAGAGNLAFYHAGLHGKSFQIFLALAKSKKFISYRRFMMGGHLLDLDWLFNTFYQQYLSSPEQAFSSDRPLYVCVTGVDSGDAAYIRADADNFEQLIKASTALPVIYRDFPEINQCKMTDGGVADSIPVKQAIDQGANRIMVIRARHRDYIKKDSWMHKLVRRKIAHHPALAAVMAERVSRHRQTMALIRNPPDGVSIIEVCPPESFSIGRFSRNSEKIIAGYEAGYAHSIKAMEQWVL